MPTLIVSEHSANSPKQIQLENGDRTVLGYLPADGVATADLASQGWQVEQPPTDRAAALTWYDTYGYPYSPSQSRRATPPDGWWDTFLTDLNQQHSTATTTLDWLQRLEPDQLPARFTIAEVPDHGPIQISAQGRLLLQQPPLDRSGDMDFADYLQGVGWRNLDPPHPVDNTTVTASPGPFTHAHLTRSAEQVQYRTESALTAIEADAASHTALDAIHRGLPQPGTHRDTTRESGDRHPGQPRPGGRRPDEGLGR